MYRLSTGIICLYLGVISISALADEMNTSPPVAEEVVIPGYSPPPSTTPTNIHPVVTQPQSPFMMPNQNSNLPAIATAPPSNPMYQSCQTLIPIGVPIDTIKNNIKDNFENTGRGVALHWRGAPGQPDINISFLEDGKAIEATGLPPSLGDPKELNFTRSDAQKVLNSKGEQMGYVYLFSPVKSKNEGKIIIRTNANNMVTSFTTTVSCELKKNALSKQDTTAD